MTFIPSFESKRQVIPFFEDQRGASTGLKGYTASKKPGYYMIQIEKLLRKLDATNVAFLPGVYSGKPTRYGYQITFSYAGNPGRIDCAALPLRAETTAKKDQAIAQCLYLLKLEIEAMANAWVYKPGSAPLVPYLVGPNNKTVTEALLEMGSLPTLKAATFLLTDGKS